MRRFALLCALASLGLGTLVLAERAIPVAHAAPTAATILASLADPAKWTSVTTSKGVAVYKKTVDGVGVPALKGVRTATVSADKLFNLVADVANQPKVNEMLIASVVLKSYGTKLDFYQVLKLPPGVSNRYWFNTAENLRNVNGEAGHHRQTWELMSSTAYAAERAEVLKTYGDLELTTLNYGFWDVADQGNGTAVITYCVLSHPGGWVPDGAFSWGSEKTLPDNVNLFVKAAGGS